MKQAAKIVLAGTILLGLSACDRPAKLDNDQAKYSYAIGNQIGRNMKAQGVELDSKAFVAAINDALGDKKIRMKDEEMRTAMRKMAEARRAKQTAAADDNLKKGQTYLAGNKSREGWKETKTGLQIQVVKEGAGKTPNPDDVVSVHYKGTLIDGTEFDSSYKRQKAAEFPVKAVIPGWTEALQMMKVGSKANLAIPPNLGYGPQGNARIPGNSVLLFEVELLAIKGKDDKKVTK